ncbi:hypothetical protein ACFVGY_04115 [Streptomyces sp. NPDC127106]|uniref:hypothetical protein n=1 Tax=Streptomyces sp. NPDC127106 TaxID=3345360 RepID=UPI00363BF37D
MASAGQTTDGPVHHRVEVTDPGAWFTARRGFDPRTEIALAHHLAPAYEAVAATHNQLGLTEPVDPAARPYHTRPFQVLHAERFTAALRTRITHPRIGSLPTTGAVDQFVDSTDVLCHPELTRAATNGLLSP